MDDDAARRWLSPSTEAATSTATSADRVGWYTARLWPCRPSILLERLGPAEAGRGGRCARDVLAGGRSCAGGGGGGYSSSGRPASRGREKLGREAPSWREPSCVAARALAAPA